ncbi:NUDIX hydrolase [Candidatus Uhrbacteria bacterium]|nr:NUDIX hydrolase [Candidatus Uhrbacteria bacterium]
MHEFKTGTNVFYDHLGRPNHRPDDAPINWRPSAYALVCNGNLVLMVEGTCTPGVWTLPGGGIEPHEEMLDGLRRECREELGFEVDVQSQTPVYFGEHSFYFEWTGEFLHSLVHVFSGRVTDDVLERLLPLSPDPSEILRIAWMDPQNLDETNCHFVVWPLIQRYRY